MLTGRYTHNMNTPVVNNSRWGNCASALWSSVDEQHTLGTTMKELGYETAFFGKYLNEYGDWDNSTGDAYNQYAATPMTHVPPGWDRWVVRKGGDPYYWNYTISVDGLEEAHYVDSAVPKAGTPVSQFVVVRKSKTQHLLTCEPKYALCCLAGCSISPHERLASSAVLTVHISHWISTRLFECHYTHTSS